MSGKKHNHDIWPTHCVLPAELWLIIGSLVGKDLWALASTCHFLAEVLYPLLYRDVVCLTPSILLRCGTAWLCKPTMVFGHVRTLSVGVTIQNAGNFPNALEWSGLLYKWRLFTPILERFTRLTHLQFIFLALPRTFPVVLTSLPMMTDLTVERCTFTGPVSFYGVVLSVVRLRLKDVCWDDEPDEITLVRGCPLLEVLYLGWHYRIADTLNVENTRNLSQHLRELTVNSVLQAWSGNRTERVKEQQTFFNFIEAWSGLKALTLKGGWPLFDTGAFPAAKQALPDYLVAYTGPIHFYRSTIHTHIGLKKAVFIEPHLSVPELLMFLPSLPLATHVALSGLCLDKEPIEDQDTLKVVLKQCKEVEELVVNPAHVPLQGAAWMLNILRRCLHHRQKIRFIFIPGIDAHDLDVEHGFDGLDDICPSLRLIQFHKRKWDCGNGKWTEIDM
ncbi:hypothetical protein C8J55DRAFT_559521 [Lentinula edodes]|uniref:F-box domain-containing protein n=1 Tax=Lentinula lateritia TaxID=40482 RepID=A0A9W9AM27_9AGAR|nr:hypothetical protein C8J55DRAFT_559521 [Lentinula edodes]